MLLGTTSKDSKIGGTINIQFAEDDTLTVTKIMKLWVEYTEGVYLGEVFSAEGLSQNFIKTQNSFIDYMSSIYIFNTHADGSTLLHWSRYTGCFPLTIPYNNFQSEDGDVHIIDRVDVKFAFAYKEDLNPAILTDFNKVSAFSVFGNMDFTNYYEAPARKAFLTKIGNANFTDPLKPGLEVFVKEVKTPEDAYSTGMPRFKLVLVNSMSPEQLYLEIGGQVSNELPYNSGIW